jgi:hypothetical protein
MSEERYAQCPFCPKKFKSLLQLSDHMSAEHKGEDE